MKFVMAVLACIGIFFVYTFLGVTVFGWERGGGILPQLIMFAAMAAVWRAITKKKKEKNDEERTAN